MGFHGGPVAKNSLTCQSAGDTGSIPESGRSPGGSMATYSSILPWAIPWTEEPGSLWSMGLQRVRYAYVKRITSPGSMHDTGCFGLVHWDDPDGWDGEGGGRVVQDGEHMYSHGGFKSKYGKTNTML